MRCQDDTSSAQITLGDEPAIILAAWNGDLEATRAILDAGADINTI